MIEAGIDEIDDAVAQARQCMAEASRIVLDGFEVQTDTEIIRYPDRYMDPRGLRMWELVQQVLEPREPPEPREPNQPPEPLKESSSPRSGDSPKAYIGVSSQNRNINEINNIGGLL
jgi:hypothetical protein